MLLEWELITYLELNTRKHLPDMNERILLHWYDTPTVKTK